MTKFLTGVVSGFLPSSMTGGVMGLIVPAAVAVGAGQLGGRLLKNHELGQWVMMGGLLVVAIAAIGQYFPSLPLPLGLGGTSGMGLISSSNFYVPQVNRPGSMASFVTPAGIRF